MDIAVVLSDAPVSATEDLASASAENFAQLVGPYVSRMGRLAERLCSAADRDDVLQEALVRAWLKRHTFDSQRGSLSAWLMAITADQARKLRRRRRPPLSAPIAPSRAEESVDLERAVLLLPPRQKLAVDCYYFVGLSVAETAAVMRCSTGTVKSTLSDARANLRAGLEMDE